VDLGSNLVLGIGWLLLVGGVLLLLVAAGYAVRDALATPPPRGDELPDPTAVTVGLLTTDGNRWQFVAAVGMVVLGGVLIWQGTPTVAVDEPVIIESPGG
jgi:hypothetical protein